MGMNGIIEQVDVLKGSLSAENTMRGALSAESSMTGALSGEQSLNATIGSAVEGRYNGEYSFTPSKTDQVINTDYKLLTKDLVVKGIPYYEVSNESGITIVIGDE